MPILAAGSQAASWGIMVLYVVLIIGFMYFLDFTEWLLM